MDFFTEEATLDAGSSVSTFKELRVSHWVEQTSPYNEDEVTRSSTVKQKKLRMAEKLCERYDPDYILNVYEIEKVGCENLSNEAAGYIATGVQDEITLRENQLAFHRIWLRPRVLIDVSVVSTRTKILGIDVALPVMLAPTALARLATPTAELAYIEAARNKNIIKILPTLSSMKTAELLQSASESSTLCFWQVYVDHNRPKTRTAIRNAESAGCKAIVVTVDAPGVGRRERDLRLKYVPKTSSSGKSSNYFTKAIDLESITDLKKPEEIFFSMPDASIGSALLNWGELEVIHSWTNLPIVLKGIQTVADAIRAAQLGFIKAIVVSNHGGRQLDFGRSGIEILAVVSEALQSVNSKMEVWVDGGVRRGIDIFKALALGASAVLIGRPMIYGAAAYGRRGVERVIEIFHEELESCMKNCGCPSVSDITASHVDASCLAQHTVEVAKSYFRERAYTPMPKL